MKYVLCPVGLIPCGVCAGVSAFLALGQGPGTCPPVAWCCWSIGLTTVRYGRLKFGSRKRYGLTLGLPLAEENGGSPACD